MQFLDADPLIKKFRSDTFEEHEVGPYFMAYMILTALVACFSSEPTAWDFAVGLVFVVITILGILHLKKQNGDTFGHSFVAKYFCLGWVVTVRMILWGVPAAVIFLVLAWLIGGEGAMDLMSALFVIAFGIIFYWWLGLLVAETVEGRKNNHL